MGNRSLDDFLGDDGTAATPESDDDDASGTGDADAPGTGDTDTPETDGADGSAAGDADGSTAAGVEESTAAGGDATEAPGTSPVEPAAPTYVARTGECVACGRTVERRWESDEGPVCPDCKDW